MFTSSAESETTKTLLVERMRDVPIGGVLTMDVIEQIIGGPIADKRHLWEAAKKTASEEYGLTFENVRAVGYKRMHTDQLPVVGERARRFIRGKARRATTTIENGVQFANDIPKMVRRRLFGELAMLGAVQAAARSSSVRKAEQDVERVRAPSVAEAAKIFAETRK